jgi:hypothetical protein
MSLSRQKTVLRLIMCSEARGMIPHSAHHGYALRLCAAI